MLSTLDPLRPRFPIFGTSPHVELWTCRTSSGSSGVHSPVTTSSTEIQDPRRQWIHFWFCALDGCLCSNLINKIDLNLLLFQLELFSLQLHHQKIEFSASGFFLLDFSLMQMVRFSQNYEFLGINIIFLIFSRSSELPQRIWLF